MCQLGRFCFAQTNWLKFVKRFRQALFLGSAKPWENPQNIYK